MLHQIAGHLIMRHDVHNAGPWTPHLSSAPFAPVVIMLNVHGLLPCRLVAASELGFQNVSPNCSRPTIIRQLLLAASGHLCDVSYHGTPWQPHTCQPMSMRPLRCNFPRLRHVIVLTPRCTRPFQGPTSIDRLAADPLWAVPPSQTHHKPTSSTSHQCSIS